MNRTTRSASIVVSLLVLSLVAGRASAQEALSADVRAKIDAAVTEVLSKSGAPSASVAIVQDGKVAYVRAYGRARLEPELSATPQMRYGIGSISKQFTAAAILLLAEDGKLSLDDRVDRWVPGLTRGGDVTIRQLLSMTSGYQDYWPQDYVMRIMREAVSADAILNQWAKKALDFEPGTKWQYSNTNYIIAGLIAQKASGQPLHELLTSRIFDPLGMKSVVNMDQERLDPEDPSRYRRFALGPLRQAPEEGGGWLFAAAGLAMTAADLARWDISVMDQSLLKPASYRELETEVRLASGVGAGYGLGVSVSMAGGRRLISHGGEVSGFTAANDIYPDDRTAVVVFTNLDATGASGQIAARIGQALFAAGDSDTQKAVEQARQIFDGLQRGQVDRTLFTENANDYFSEQALKDIASSLAPLGQPQEFTQESQGLRGGMTSRRFRIRFPQRTLRLTTFTMPDGKLEQYLIFAVE